MAHKYPRVAFGEIVARIDLPPLPRLYAALVTLELALKDDHQGSTGNWTMGHDVPTMMAKFDGSLATTLGDAIVILRCTDRFGGNSPVSRNNYPHMRYLRHNSDFPPPPTATQDAEITDALHIALQCLGVAKAAGLLA